MNYHSACRNWRLLDWKRRIAGNCAPPETSHTRGSVLIPAGCPHHRRNILSLRAVLFPWSPLRSPWQLLWCVGVHPANTVRVLLNRSPDLPGQLWVNWFIVAAAKWPGKEKGEKTEQAANHDLAALLAIPLLFAQCHPQPLANRLKCQCQRILRLVIEEATAGLANLHHRPSVIFQHLCNRSTLILGVDQVLCKPIWINAALIYSLFHIISIRYARYAVSE